MSGTSVGYLYTTLYSIHAPMVLNFKKRTWASKSHLEAGPMLRETTQNSVICLPVYDTCI